MNFARLLDQAKDLWARPIGKWLLGGIVVFLVTLGIVSLMASGPEMVPLVTLDATEAPEAAQKLNEAKIRFEQQSSSTGFTFKVSPDDYEAARLALAEAELDPASTVWAIDQWAERVSWSNTEFDKRQLWKEQTEVNLTRAIKVLSAVEQARVQISVPMQEKLFKEDEAPPKAMVVVLPRKGYKLETHVVEAIMSTVAGAVENLRKEDVVVIDASTSRVVSTDAFKQPAGGEAATGDAASALLAIEKMYQESWQENLTQRLERVVGAGNVSVIVTPHINWERVMSETLEYKGNGENGKGIPISEQRETHTAEGSGAGGTADPAGTTPNAELGVPGYPGLVAGQGGNVSEETVKTITNYLVSQTKSIVEKPGGSIEGISVGVLVNSAQVTPEVEAALKTVVATALGNTAQVEVAAMPFAPSLLSQLPDDEPAPQAPGAPSWLYMLLAVALTLGAIGSFFVFFKPRKPVLEPVFAGPEAAMLGGIPVSDLEMAAAAEAYAARSGAAATAAEPEKRVPETAEEVLALPPEEIALLGDDFLQQLGLDPSKVRMLQRVEKIARSNPEVVANLLKTWLSEG